MQHLLEARSACWYTELNERKACSTVSLAKALSISLPRKTDNKFCCLYPLLVTWLLRYSFIILVSTQANIIYGVTLVHILIAILSAVRTILMMLKQLRY